MEQNKGTDQAAPNPKAAVLEKPEVKEAIAKFKETSGLELKKLCTEGLDFQEAVNKLVDKLRSSRIQFQCNDQNLKLVSKVSGFDRRGAIRVLLIREELVRLRHLGYSTSDAIYELINRIRRLAGQKRGLSSLGNIEDERIAKRPKLKNERSKKRTFDQAGYGEESQELASGEEEIEHKKKKRKVGFEPEESSVSEVSRSDAAKEDEPSITTDQDDVQPDNNGVPRRSSAANLFSRLFSLFTAGNNGEGLTGPSENHTDGSGHQSLLLPHTPPGYEHFDEDDEDQLDDEELYEFQDDNLGDYENANVGGEFSEDELPRLNNNSESVEGDEDVNDENGAMSRKRSRDLNSNEGESEPKRKRTNNSTNSTGLFLQRQNSCK